MPSSDIIVISGRRPYELPRAPMVSRGIPGGPSWSSAASNVGTHDRLRDTTRDPGRSRGIRWEGSGTLPWEPTWEPTSEPSYITHYNEL